MTPKSVQSANAFREKMKQGGVCLGLVISFSDPTVAESVCDSLDFVWIDMEHTPLSFESVQGHLMAMRGSNAVPLVRVPWNDPVQIKRALDIGAIGVIVPLVRTADDVCQAVAACQYPPNGIRGFGPRRPSNFARLGGPEFCQTANSAVITIAQIEHIDAVQNIDSILAVPGLTGIVIGPNDLSGSLGHMADTKHPDVQRAIDMVLTKARQAKIFVGVATGGTATALAGWVERGAQWLTLGADFQMFAQAVDQLASQVRELLPTGSKG